MNGNTSSIAQKLFAVLATLILGNLGAYLLIRYLVHVDLRLAHLAPVVFLLVPVIGITISVKGGVLRRNCRHRDVGLALIVALLVTWFAVVYIYLRNMYPSVF